MGKGGVDNLVRRELRKLLMSHPYQYDRVEDGEWRNYYSLEDALQELVLALDQDDYARILAYHWSPTVFTRTKQYMDQFQADQLLDAQLVMMTIAKDFMMAYIMADPELVAMIVERDRRYQEYAARAAALSVS